MLGVLGHLVQQNYRLPGFIDLEGHRFADLPNGFAGLAAVPTLGLVQLFLSIGMNIFTCCILVLILILLLN